MVMKPLIAAVALTAVAGCAASVPTSTPNPATAARGVAAVTPRLTQAQLAAMRANLPQRLTPQQAKAELVQIPANKIRQSGRSVKDWGSYGYYPYSYLGTSYYWPYSYYGGSYYPYSSIGYGGYGFGGGYGGYPYSYSGGSYWPYSYGW